MRQSIWPKLRVALGLLLCVLVVIFFVAEFRKNLGAFSSLEIKLNLALLAISLVLYLITYGLTTRAWQLAFNLIALRSERYWDVFGLLNVSGLAKYLPGKVWSYALQIEWFKSRGVQRFSTLWVNLVCEFSSLGLQTLLGLLFLLILRRNDSSLIALTFCFGVLFYLGVLRVITDPGLLKWCFDRIERLTKLTLAQRGVGLSQIFKIQTIYIVAFICYGVSAVLTARGLGIQVDAQDAIAIASATLLSSVIGYIMLLSPGGLGIREFIMFLVLDYVANKQLALLIPVATRVVAMLGDLILGLSGLVLMKKSGALSKGLSKSG